MKIGIIGFGHLGKALAKGLLYKKIVSKDEIYILAKSEATKKEAQSGFGIKTCSDINEMLQNTEILFWVISKNVFTELCTHLQQDVRQKVHVSFMAGITIASIQQKLGQVSVTRAMPSIAIDKADAVIGYTKTDNTYIKYLLHKLGYAFETDEKDIEKVTAFSSCGLGFAAYILSAFQKVGEDFGFDSEVSKSIVAKTFKNAIAMSDYEETANAVATKGGATEQGILCFKEKNLNGLIHEAMNQAYNKVK